MSEYPDYLTVAEAAKYLKISVGTLNRRRQLRLDPAFVKIGWLVRYRRADLDAWMAENRVQVR